MFTHNLKKSLLLAILSWSSFIASLPEWGTEGYALSITRVPCGQVIQLEISKGKRLISSVNVPYSRTRVPYSKRCIFQEIHDRTGIFGVVNERKGVEINLKEENNLFRITVNDCGRKVILNELAMADPLLLKVEGPSNSMEIHANEVMWLKSHFGIDAPGNSLVSDAGAHFYIGGEGNLFLPGGKIELKGRFQAQKNLTIETNRYVQPYGDVERVDGKKFSVIGKNGKPSTCVEYDEKAPSERSWVGSKEASVNLIANIAGIYGGVIQAKDHIVARVRDTMEVSSQCAKHARCSTYHEDTGWLWSNYVKRADREYFFTCDPAVLSAGADISAVVDGVPYKATSGGAMPPGFHNTGILSAGNSVDISSTDKLAEIYNIVPEGVEQPVYQPISVLFTEYLKHKGLAERASKHDKFMFTHPLLKDDDEEGLRPLNELVFLKDDESRSLTGHERMLFSFNLQAEALSELFLAHVGLPTIEGHRDNNFAQQLLELQDNGYLCGLANGQMIQVQGDGIPGSHEAACVPPLTDEEQSFFSDVLQQFKFAPNSIAPLSIKKRLSQIKAGTHITALTQSKIDACPLSFVYYKVGKHKGEKCIIPCLHVGKKDFEANSMMSAILGKHITIHNVRKVINTGTIHAINKVKIQADQVVNKATLSKKYSIRTPLAGGEIVGFDIEIEVPKGPATDKALKPGIFNVGGTIFGRHTVTLYAKKGDVVNQAVIGSHTVRWDPGFLGKVFGHKSSSRAIDFYPGRIISGGDMDLVSEAGFLINEGSKIIAGSNANLKGYSGTLFKTLMSKHTQYSGARIKGLSIEQVTKEALQVQRSEVTSLKGDIHVDSDNGANTSMGGSFKAHKNFKAKSKKGNSAQPAITTLDEHVQEMGFGLFGLQAVDHTYSHDHAILTEIDAGGAVVFDTELDNTLEAVILHSGKPIHLIAKRDTVIKGKKSHTSHTTSGWTLGVSFFGSEALEALAGGAYEDAIWALNDEDPLLRAIGNLATAANSADALAAGTYTGIEALRLLIDYSNTIQNKGSKAGMLGSRLGITDRAGNFFPNISFRAGHSKSYHKQTSTLKTEIHAPEVHFEGGYNVLWLDAPQFVGTKKATVEAKNFKVRPAETKESSHDRSSYMGVGLDGSFEAGTRSKREQSTTYENTNLHDLDEITINAQNADLQGVTIDANSATVNVENNLKVSSVEDTHESHSYSVGGGIGPRGVSGSYSQQTTSKHAVNQASGINGKEKLHVNVKGTSTLQGAYVTSDSPEATFTCEHFYHEDIHEHHETRGFGIGGTASTQGSDDAGIFGIFDAGLGVESKRGTTRATVSSNIHIKTKSDTSDLNRDITTMQLRGPKNKTNIRIVIPFVSTKKLGELYKQLRNTNDPRERDAIEQAMERVMQEEAHVEEDPEDSEPDIKEERQPASSEGKDQQHYENAAGDPQAETTAANTRSGSNR